MGQLYDIAERYKNLEELSENEDLDKETITEILKAKDGVDVELKIKCENIGRLIRNLTAKAEMIGKEEKFLTAKKKRAEKNIRNLKLYLYDCLKLTNKQKIETNLFKFSIQKNQPALVIDDVFSVPDEYFHNEKVLDKDLLKQKLKEGLEVAGASLKQSESLRIR